MGACESTEAFPGGGPATSDRDGFGIVRDTAPTAHAAPEAPAAPTAHEECRRGGRALLEREVQCVADALRNHPNDPRLLDDVSRAIARLHSAGCSAYLDLLERLPLERHVRSWPAGSPHAADHIDRAFELAEFTNRLALTVPAFRRVVAARETSAAGERTLTLITESTERVVPLDEWVTARRAEFEHRLGARRATASAALRRDLVSLALQSALSVCCAHHASAPVPAGITQISAIGVQTLAAPRRIEYRLGPFVYTLTTSLLARFTGDWVFEPGTALAIPGGALLTTTLTGIEAAEQAAIDLAREHDERVGGPQYVWDDAARVSLTFADALIRRHAKWMETLALWVMRPFQYSECDDDDGGDDDGGDDDVGVAEVVKFARNPLRRFADVLVDAQPVPVVRRRAAREWELDGMAPCREAGGAVSLASFSAALAEVARDARR